MPLVSGMILTINLFLVDTYVVENSTIVWSNNSEYRRTNTAWVGSTICTLEKEFQIRSLIIVWLGWVRMGGGWVCTCTYIFLWSFGSFFSCGGVVFSIFKGNSTTIQGHQKEHNNTPKKKGLELSRFPTPSSSSLSSSSASTTNNITWTRGLYDQLYISASRRISNTRTGEVFDSNTFSPANCTTTRYLK